MESDPAAARPRRAADPGLKRLFFLLVCVGLPVAALTFELLTHGCLTVLFDPIPTWPHVLLVGSVPAAVLFADIQLRRGRIGSLPCAATGFAFGVALVYTILFVQILPFSLVGVIFYGVGLLPLAPLAALIGSLLRGAPFARRLPSGWRIFGAAAAAGLAVVALLEVPGWIVLRGLEKESVPWLRWGSRSVLLRAAQSGTRNLNLTAHLRRGVELFGEADGRPDDLRRNRTLFYRVTGEDATALPLARLPGIAAPRLFGRTRWTSAADAPGLSLSSSRIDATAFSDEGIAYLEWTLAIQNDASFDQEASARLALPPGGVVTRANLWIGEQEREAAFAPRERASAAYASVVQARRDPLLVTSDRPGEASIRAFPVPPNGQSMRVRIGITAPLALASPERAELQLPAIAEQNFAIPPGFAHHVWLESHSPIEATPAALESLGEKGGVATARGDLPSSEAERTLVVSRRAGARELWTHDLSGDTPGFVRQSVESQSIPERRWIAVVDGSLGAGRQREGIADALAALAGAGLVGLVVAAEEPVWLLEKAKGDPRRALEQLRAFPFREGRDNQAALEAAWDRAVQQPDTSILWLYAAAPLPIRPPDALLQRLEHSADVAIVAVPLEARSNALLDALPYPSLEIARVADLRTGLAALGASGSNRWTFTRERFAQAPEAAQVLPADRDIALHVAQLWASDEVTRRLANGHGSNGDGARAADLAARYRVVTPLSGAVVLETDDQYRAAGLDVPEASADAPNMPVVPEPGTGLLLGLGLALLAAKRRRKARVSP